MGSTDVETHMRPMAFGTLIAIVMEVDFTTTEEDSQSLAASHISEDVTP